ncbi:hypothetical protein EFE22_09475 [Lactobacillus delbrueckii subsp. lactis]|uniref:hypothetical protein n=1 Tax=Lactobacillus delbrueckii TaxID=1584 RepID=UPI001E46048A|nr:hypothetical protein [Lactobacillus delbrueckii]MCD5531043.1 hypothetical protein [Lactobacillus delbrueckii subsp. lactis]MCS8615953.1 hypothetical protein [Lactobacillus delbrueckii subsp. lactis]
MTTEEFIEKVNALSEDERYGVWAFLAPTGEPVIATNSASLRSIGPLWLAYLPNYTKSWKFLEKRTIPGCVLKLMGELADSRYQERQYAILNGKPYRDIEGNQLFNCFQINVLGCLEQDSGVYLSELTTYTKSELEELKKGLPWTMQEAIDALTVPVDEALKMGEDNDHME